MPPQGRDWFDEYRIAVLAQFESHNATMKELRQEIRDLTTQLHDIKIKIAQLELKAALLGAVIGSVVGGAVMAMFR